MRKAGALAAANQVTGLDEAANDHLVSLVRDLGRESGDVRLLPSWWDNELQNNY